MSKIKNSKDLEERVLLYSQKLRESIERNPEYRSVLEEVARRHYSNFSSYIKGFGESSGIGDKAVGYTSKKLGETGRRIGYAGDLAYLGGIGLAYLASFVPGAAPVTLPLAMTLGGSWLATKATGLAMQTGEAYDSAKYAMREDLAGGAKNLGAIAASAVPGAGLLSYLISPSLKKQAEKRMIRDTIYTMNEETGGQHKYWHERSAERAMKVGYTGVKNRHKTGNIIKADFSKKKELRKAA